MLVNSFYFEMIEETLKHLINTGIMKHIYESYIGKMVEIQDIKLYFKVISIKDLQICFILWGGLCCFSIICFIFEILFKIHRTKRF